MSRLAIVTLFLLAMASNVRASVIRHDRADSQYRALAAYFPSVGKLTWGGALCSGTLIVNPTGSGNHWVLTAAHCLDGSTPGTGYTFDLTDGGGGVHTGLEKFIHPGYDGGVFSGYDVGLLKLSTNETSVAAAILNTVENEVGKTYSLVGYGRSGTGLTGMNSPAGTKRAGTNVFDHDGTTVGYPWNLSQFNPNDRSLYSDFDRPDGTDPYGMGSTTPTDLEAQFANGDSGGGWFMDPNGLLPGDPGYSPVLAAVGSWYGWADGTGNNDYGDFAVGMRVSKFHDWINDTIRANDGGVNPVPEPATIAVWSLIGLCGVGYGVRRRMNKAA